MRGGGYIKCALIGLAPYIFHYDLSKSYGTNNQLLQYYIAFDDLHNFWLPKERLFELFQKKFLSFRLPAQIADLNNIYGEKTALRIMNWEIKLNVRDSRVIRDTKNYPETVKENVKILDDYLTLCDKHNIRAIIFLPTMTQVMIKYYNRKKLDEFYYLIREAQKKHHSAVFFDGWKLDGFSDANFYDAAHLNINGAAKFSTILNNAIEQLEKG